MAASPGRYSNYSLWVSVIVVPNVVLVVSGDVWIAHISSPPLSVQEMTAIMHSIYDMMGKYTYPNMRDNAPKDHVDNFFQVKHTNPQTSTHLSSFKK